MATLLPGQLPGESALAFHIRTGYDPYASHNANNGPGSIAMGPQSAANGYIIPANSIQTNNVPVNNNPVNNNPVNNGPSPEDILNQQYSDYLGNVGNMENTINTQKTNQEAQAGSVYNEGVNNLNSGYDLNTNQINTNQGKSLRDIGSSIQAGFNAGNNLLGSMGAGDSSAANMYSYALAKEGSKQRGNAMENYNNQRFQLKNQLDQGMRTLASQRDQAIYNVASWFSQQQMTLQGMRADAARDRSSQLLSIAAQKLASVDQAAQTMKQNLTNWALSVSTNLGQLNTNMTGIGQYTNPQVNSTAYNIRPVGSAAPNYYNNANNNSNSSNDTNTLFKPVDYNWLT
jgi:hypothetical protein